MVRPYQKDFVFIESGEGIISSTGTSVVTAHDKSLSKFIFHQFFSKRFSKYCEDRMTGTSYPAITPRDIEEYKVAIPRNQDYILMETEKLDKMDHAKLTTKSKISSSKALLKSLINQVF